MTGLAIRHQWEPLTAAACARLEAAAGVFELRDEHGVSLIDYAGAGSRFGLRGELTRLADTAGPTTQFRVEVTSTYLSRWRELLSSYWNTFGHLPRGNADHHPIGLRPFGNYGEFS